MIQQHSTVARYNLATGHWHWLWLTLLLLTWRGSTNGQPPSDPQPTQDASAQELTVLDSDSLNAISAIDTQRLDRMAQQIAMLNNTSYRVRQSAKLTLEQDPQASLQAIANHLPAASPVSGVQMVDLISGLAMHSDPAISTQAIEMLHSLAGEATSVGRGAANSLSAIADLQEEQAVEILVHYGAYIGPQNFSINGKIDLTLPMRLSLVIDDRFTGTDDELERIRFLKSIEVVYLRGPNASSAAIVAASHLKQLKGLKLRNLSITQSQLLLFCDLQSLEQLGISYVAIDDTCLPELLQLPITESIRLLGTKISDQGQHQLVQRFKGVEVFRGLGGFLGISSVGNSLEVKEVTPRSAADRAGLRPGDIILSVNDQVVKNFEQLRTHLATHSVGDVVQIQYERQGVELTAAAKLQEEP